MRVYEHYKNPSGEFIFTLKREKITGKKLTNLKKDISLIQKLRPVSERFLPLKKSYDKFKQWKESFGSDPDEIEDIVANYLSKTSSFVDQWNSFFKKEYPDLHSFFDKERRAMYDKSFSYRLIYNLRNMDHHTHQFPFSQVTKSVERSPVIILEKDYFLNAHKGMQSKFHKELKRLDEESFNLAEIIDQSHAALSELHEKTSNKIMEKLDQDGLISSAYRILKFYKDHQENNGVVGLTNDELDPAKIKEKDFRQTLKLKDIPHELAYFGALSCSIELNYVGVVNEKKTTHFPLEKDGNIYRGADRLRYRGVIWIKISEPVFNLGDNKSAYSVLYIVDGLPFEAYDRKKQEFVKEKRKMSISLTDEHYKKMKLLKIDDSAKILIIYFFEEKAIKQEIIFRGSAEQLRKKHLGDDWDGFNLGDSFQLNDEKVRVYVKKGDLVQKNNGYFIGPDNLNPNKINYSKLKFQDYSDK